MGHLGNLLSYVPRWGPRLSHLLHTYSSSVQCLQFKSLEILNVFHWRELCSTHSEAQASCASSVVTVLIGLIYAYWHFPSLSLKFSDCYFESPNQYTPWVDCNNDWATEWGMVGVPTWVPLILGLTGAMMANPSILQVVGFPRNFLQHGIFLIVQAMFANIGYCGKLGVATGFCSIALGVIDIVAYCFGIRSDRMKELQRLKEGIGYTTQEDEDESMSE